MRCKAMTQWVELWNFCNSTIYYGRLRLSGIDAARRWQRWMVMGLSVAPLGRNYFFLAYYWVDFSR
eukprot:scaffold382549_cov31-Attheya_sp.AAC.1